MEVYRNPPWSLIYLAIIYILVGCYDEESSFIEILIKMIVKKEKSDFLHFSLQLVHLLLFDEAGKNIQAYQSMPLYLTPPIGKMS